MKVEPRARALAAFARCGSFIGAAEELHVSQPAISQHIAEIERRLGIPLIERRSRKLTAAGDLLARHILRAEAILAQGVRCVSALGQSRGSLSIIASGTPGTYVLPQVVARFQQAHAGVRIDFRLGTSAEVVACVRSHRAEIGVAGAFPATAELEVEHLLDDEVVVVGAPNLQQKRFSRDDLERLTWISREEGSGTRDLGDAAAADIGFAPQHRLVLPSWEAIKLAVRAGAGIAACSHLSVAEECAAGMLARLPLLPRKVVRSFSVIRIRDASATPAAETFLQMLRAHCAEPAMVPRGGGTPRAPHRRGR
jgi:LysR family transcriptional regulator, transcriptional activator of the cysJI operon